MEEIIKQAARKIKDRLTQGEMEESEFNDLMRNTLNDICRGPEEYIAFSVAIERGLDVNREYGLENTYITLPGIPMKQKNAEDTMAYDKIVSNAQKRLSHGMNKEIFRDNIEDYLSRIDFPADRRIELGARLYGICEAIIQPKEEQKTYRGHTAMDLIKIVKGI